MDRMRQLRDRDVRLDAPDLSPGEFLKNYLDSNFPQTSAHPSSGQQPPSSDSDGENELNFKKMKGPSSGVGFDRPQVS
jgi:hypothetical protein